MEPLETTRLVLRPFQPKDWQAVMALFSDTAVSRWTFSLATSSDAYRWLRQQMAQRDGVSLAIVLRQSGNLIGWICSEPESRPPFTPALQAVEGEIALRYALASAHWGRGYMTEAVQAVINYNFTVLKAPQVTADCALGNEASRRVMEKAGMVYAGIEKQYAPDMSFIANHRFVLPRSLWQAQVHGESGV